MKYITFIILIFNTFLFSNDFPNKEFNLIVPFAEGGSTDRMARVMQPFLEDELTYKVNVINKKGQGTLFGNKYFLNSSTDGYNLLVSSFSPYISNTILAYNAPYTINNFEIINIQWFDFEFIAVNQHSPYSTLVELLNAIKNTTKPLKVAVLHKSTGELIVKLLMEKFNIQKDKLEFKYFHGGKQARESLIAYEVDFIVISAKGSEKYREFIKPLSIIKEKRSNRWDAPTINEALLETKITFPIFNGSMRGLAVSKKFKQTHPKRYIYLVKSLKKILAKRKVIQELKKYNIGSSWIGPENSNKLLKESYTLFEKYNYLRED